MKNNNSLNNTQFMMSYEILHLLKWLLANEQEALKKIIIKSVNNGLMDELDIEHSSKNNEEHLQQNIIDFFSLLEILFYEVLNESKFNKQSNRNILPMINNIDSTIFDSSAVEMSIAKATSMHKLNSKEDLKTILCKELLKRWRPDKKLIKN